MKTPTAAAAVARLYLGTMTFGWSQSSQRVDETVAYDMLERFVTAQNNNDHRDGGGGGGGGGGGRGTRGGCHIDTARIYAGGKTETILGHVLKSAVPQTANILLGTKAHPSQPGGLSADGIQQQFQSSVDAMGLSKNDCCIHEYYLHQPDPNHTLLESLQTMHTLVLQGRIQVIGLSNYHASEVQRAFELCQEYQLTPPQVYQGLYNPLNRLVEDELLPILRTHNCAFVAYNPLAAGLLTGKHTNVNPDQAAPGRFKKNPNYLPRFYTPDNFDALHLIQQACDAVGLGMVEATYRWLLRHSALHPTDGVLIGASSIQQLDHNLAACHSARVDPPLPDSVLRAFDEAWNITRSKAFPYWRSYSLDMPDRDALDPGASYEAAKK